MKHKFLKTDLLLPHIIIAMVTTIFGEFPGALVNTYEELMR
jgi:hypothetical protein